MIYSQIALILIGAFWAPWWWLSIVGLLYGWRFQKSYKIKSLLYASFLSGFVVWFIFTYYYDLQGGGRVGQWLADLFHLRHNFVVYSLSGVIAGSVNALSCFVGSRLQSIKF
jgi:hypothetical protein